MNTLLAIRDLHVRYPLKTGLSALAGNRPSFVDVVHGVSLDINRGETVAIVGESGSGKTTLAMAVCGLAPVFRGEVRFDGRQLERERNNRLNPDRKRVALMFQDPVGSLSPRMTVRKILAEPFRIHRTGSSSPEQEARRLLSLVGLSEDFGDRYPHQLSGGQARRVGVARALALEPDLLIADEPTAGLDVSIQGEVLNLMSRLQQQMGLGIMIITHNLNVVRHIADRMAIMYLGRFVEQGDAQKIFSRPRHPYTEALLSANPSTDPDAGSGRIELSGEVPSLLRRPAGCEFNTRCPRAGDRCRVSFPGLAGDFGDQAYHCHFPLD
ncbi:MAG: ABC transporter ATP-binding protein [Xanthomonadales bacterium]|nr:ABC transporter ATP-binding protein [Gammaproteobacteria bacterium]MBT8055262.1 ABC transporter ATP-binding protein [Gammaproteobacteria bacterium]NND55794.1 ABC transporter ATP-binding protein [Xanthomonadales bacterium]NNK50058.1 ABC transporter ATP-binding protein [Xanthomonadales bacterium]